MTRVSGFAVGVLVLCFSSWCIQAFVAPSNHRAAAFSGTTNAGVAFRQAPHNLLLFAAKKGEQKKISQKRRDQLGIADDEDEYDLGFALEQNTDPLISKIIAGSLILVIIALLVVGVIVPSLTDYGEGVCSPIQSGGRC